MDGNRKKYASRNLWSGVLFGIGLMAFIDEVIFHQLLQWHHFYDLSTTTVGVFSDGLLNAFAWFAAIGSLFIFADLRRRQALWMMKWGSGVLMGAGGFQLFDGLINHKLLRVHQIRYGVDLLPYDLAWNIGAAIFVIIGFTLWRRTVEQGGRNDA